MTSLGCIPPRHVSLLNISSTLRCDAASSASQLPLFGRGTDDGTDFDGWYFLLRSIYMTALGTAVFPAAPLNHCTPKKSTKQFINSREGRGEGYKSLQPSNTNLFTHIFINVLPVGHVSRIDTATRFCVAIAIISQRCTRRAFSHGFFRAIADPVASVVEHFTSSGSGCVQLSCCGSTKVRDDLAPPERSSTRTGSGPRLAH